ncbi:hypothetical protein B0H66DRAFT_384578 [Apodospora peruviana]|uniref:Secreted protein n=1 Tax=Apodospora peruviana TaxID=516989 RepID=A0AAE0LZ66_9PEZI|nr:hypothetical protein B0H66DRAFT_384578 [Apodospora peruviana]
MLFALLLLSFRISVTIILKEGLSGSGFGSDAPSSPCHAQITRGCQRSGRAAQVQSILLCVLKVLTQYLVVLPQRSGPQVRERFTNNCQFQAAVSTMPR